MSFTRTPTLDDLVALIGILADDLKAESKAIHQRLDAVHQRLDEIERDRAAES